MVDSRRQLSAAEVLHHIRSTLFTSSVEGRVGAEVEWFPVYADRPGAYVPLEQLQAILNPFLPLPSGGSLTFEPGGQLEISSPPGETAAATCSAIAADLELLETKLRPHGIALLGVGLDPLRPGRRVLDLPRYEAMEAYFDAGWPEGRAMMRATASVHVNLDVEGVRKGGQRWRLVHAMGPALAASFSNSAVARGKPTGWKSARLALWQGIDPSRTLPVRPLGDPVAAWMEYALRARVMFIRRGGTAHPIAEKLSFGRWMEEGHELGYPELEDLVLHLTTLFPPVRPRGWLELRMIDAQEDPWWRVPIVVACAVYDPQAARRIERLAEPTADLWEVAARLGMENELLAHTAQGIFSAVLDAIDRLGVDEETASVVEAYFRRFVQKGRSPADEQLEAWRAVQSSADVESMEDTWT